MQPNKKAIELPQAGREMVGLCRLELQTSNVSE
jgi:hypothetical protein